MVAVESGIVTTFPVARIPEATRHIGGVSVLKSWATAACHATMPERSAGVPCPSTSSSSHVGFSPKTSDGSAALGDPFGSRKYSFTMS